MSAILAASLLVTEAHRLVEQREAATLVEGIFVASRGMERAHTNMMDRARSLALDSIGALPIAQSEAP